MYQTTIKRVDPSHTRHDIIQFVFHAENSMFLTNTKNSQNTIFFFFGLFL